MEVKHISGIHNETADFLSRILLNQDPDIPQINLTLMQDSQFSRLLNQFTQKLKPVFTDEFKQNFFPHKKHKLQTHTLTLNSLKKTIFSTGIIQKDATLFGYLKKNF